MTGFVARSGAAGNGAISRDDQSIGEWVANGDLYMAKNWDRVPADDYLMDVHFGSEWWPSRSSLMCGWDGEPANQIIGDAPWYAWPNTRSGCNGRLGFVGYTRDRYGTVIPGCSVKCFRTSTDELVASVTSDANGLYFATTPYGDAHYLVVQNPFVVPPVAGASLNTVTPA